MVPAAQTIPGDARQQIIERHESHEGGRSAAGIGRLRRYIERSGSPGADGRGGDPRLLGHRRRRCAVHLHLRRAGRSNLRGCLHAMLRSQQPCVCLGGQGRGGHSLVHAPSRSRRRKAIPGVVSRKGCRGSDYPHGFARGHNGTVNCRGTEATNAQCSGSPGGGSPTRRTRTVHDVRSTRAADTREGPWRVESANGAHGLSAQTSR